MHQGFLKEILPRVPRAYPVGLTLSIGQGYHPSPLHTPQQRLFGRLIPLQYHKLVFFQEYLAGVSRLIHLIQSLGGDSLFLKILQLFLGHIGFRPPRILFFPPGYLLRSEILRPDANHLRLNPQQNILGHQNHRLLLAGRLLSLPL